MSSPAVFPIEGVIRRYTWGSTSSIQHLLGVEPDGRPAAELWFGAHPGDPSPALGRTLDHVIAADPDAVLGTDTVRQFGPRLPYLLKVLAAATALSIQVHPNAEQARAGYDAEQAAGLAADDPHRTYSDPHHKPELLCALTPFEALCGFRPIDETLTVIAAVPELAFLADRLRGPDGLRAAFTALLTHDQPARLADAVAARAEPDGPLRPAYLAASDFPGDIGVAVSVLLNYVRLQPGEAIYLGAGNVHAYLRGTGVEIMANSDNVLRCGLTAKHIDVEELLRITDFSPLREPRWPARGGSYTVPVPDFRLHVCSPGSPVPTTGPRIVLCAAGTVGVEGVELRPGHAAFVAASTGPVSLTGDGTAYVAAVNLDAG